MSLPSYPIRKITAGILLIIISLLLSLLRENTFLIINGIILGTGSYKANTAPPQWLLNNFSPEQLLLLKWPLTAFFCVFFIGLNLLTLKVVFNSKMLIKFIFGIYIFFILMGIILLITGYLTGSFQMLFRPAQLIFAAIQTPLPLLVTFAFSFAYAKLHKRSNEH